MRDSGGAEAALNAAWVPSQCRLGAIEFLVYDPMSVSSAVILNGLHG